jgi:uracil-DNA glycosylase
MVVGQDFSDRAYFEKWRGRDRPNSPTNLNLIQLFASIGIAIHGPGEDRTRDEAFFTNAILCLKDGGMQARVQDEWFINCGSQFLRSQVELVAPRVVVGLGARAHNAVLAAFGFAPSQLRDAVGTAGTRLPTGALLVGVYHCGARVVNMTRSLQQQARDWQRVRAALDAPAV